MFSRGNMAAPATLIIFVCCAIVKRSRINSAKKVDKLPTGGTFEIECYFPELNDQRSQVDAQLMQNSSDNGKFEVEKFGMTQGISSQMCLFNGLIKSLKKCN